MYWIKQEKYIIKDVLKIEKNNLDIIKYLYQQRLKVLLYCFGTKKKTKLKKKKNQLGDIEYVIGLQLINFNPSPSSSKVLCVRAWHHLETTCTQLIHSPWWWWNQCHKTPTSFEELHCKPIWTYIFPLHNYVCEFLFRDESLQHLPSGSREFPWDPPE